MELSLDKGVDSASDADVQWPAVVVTSRMIELLQPQELQALFVGTLSSGLVPGTAPECSFLCVLLGCEKLLVFHEMSDWA